MSLLRDKIFASVALGHLIVDMINGLRAILLAFLSGPLGLSNSTIGVISMVYQLVGAIGQPLFGYLTDRLGPRWVVTGGVLWLGVFYTLGLTIPGAIALVFIVLASIGSGAFHPAGAMQATIQGRDLLAGREATAASFFFIFGQFGFFFGPLIGGALLGKWGPVALLSLVLLAIPFSGVAANWLQDVRPPAHQKQDGPYSRFSSEQALPAAALAALAVTAMFQQMSESFVSTYVPKYLNDLGQSPSYYGFLAALFMGGSGVGNVIGGHLADRFGKKRLILAAMSLSSLPMFLIGRAGGTAWMILLVTLTGLLNGAAYSAIIVMAQRMIPGGMGLASGLILGFNFTSGALGMLLGGVLADKIGFPLVFLAAAVISLLGGFSMLALKSETTAAVMPVVISAEEDRISE